MPEPPGAPGGAVDGAVDGAPTDTRPLARACAISLRYGDRAIFADFSVDIAVGRLTVVRGRSGAGKSTLLRLLLGLADPDAGDVELAGSRLAGLDRAARAALRQRHVGVVTQSGALAEPLDAVANLTLARTARGLPADADAVDAVLQKLSLAAVARRPVRLLSGGERQRVSIARALVVDRPLLVLDEPTSQQDEAHAELVTAALRAAADAGAGVLCATHDEVLAAAAARVVELG